MGSCRVIGGTCDCPIGSCYRGLRELYWSPYEALEDYLILVLFVPLAMLAILWALFQRMMPLLEEEECLGES